MGPLEPHFRGAFNTNALAFGLKKIAAYFYLGDIVFKSTVFRQAREMGDYSQSCVR